MQSAVEPNKPARMKRTWTWLCSMPPFGKLSVVSREAKLQAFFETATTTIFATMPFWILPTLGSFLFSPRPELNKSFSSGEGLIYASVLLGPLIYVLTRRYGRFSFPFKKPIRSPLSISFPYGGAFVLITAFACFVSGFSFAALKTPSHAAFNTDGILLLSYILMICATVVFYLVTAYRNMLEELEKKPEVLVTEQPEQENKFVDDWMAAKQ